MGRSLQGEQAASLSLNTAQPPPSEARAGTPKHCLESCVELSSERARRARNFTAQGNRISGA